MVSHGSTEDHNRNREVYYSQVLEDVHNIPQGATLRGQSRVQAEREQKDLRHMSRLGSLM